MTRRVARPRRGAPPLPGSTARLDRGSSPRVRTPTSRIRSAVHGAGRIRGYHEPEPPDVVDRVVRDAARVANGG